jgi:two-component system LytT family sensor kinase
MKKLFDNRWFLFAMPFVIWFLLLILPFLASTDIDNNFFPSGAHRRWILNIISANALLLCVFYVHTYLVYPLINKKVVWYVLALAALLGLYWLCWYLTKGEPRHFVIKTQGGQLPQMQNVPRDLHFKGRGEFRFRIMKDGPANFFPLISPLVAILCSICYRVILDNRVRQQLLKERETSQLQTELTFLRSQISPHFMFNVLNNLVALARKKSDDLEPALMNLSQLMRYMLYESDDNRVLLSKEIAYIKSYIDLQKLRFGNYITVNINIDGDMDMYAIEPMLLIPFVENAFKHGTGMIENPVININIAVEPDTHLLHFEVDNTISPMDVSKDSSSGIGISNVKRRLAILHHGKHDLSIVNEDNTFTVKLDIYLSN